MWKIRHEFISYKRTIFSRLFNQKVGSKEMTSEIQIPSNFKKLMYQKSPVKEKKTARRKKVIFNLDQYDEESKEEESE